ncbi:hypothetical protein MD484_g6502, partial [Candolleomyces efflorescens]
MPRRRSGKAKGGPAKPKKLKRSDATLKKWNTVDDIPLDEVDQFHTGRDKILLEGDEDYDDEDQEEEVFGLKGLGDDVDEDEDGFEDDDFGEEDGVLEPKKAEKKKKGKGKKQGKGGLSSDEDEEEKEPEEEGWGRGKAAYYNSNADELDSEDEEGHELEEQEAKRLQAKAREDLNDEDFGLNDIVEIQKDDIDLALEEPKPASAPVLPTDPKDLLRYLERTNPETVALARDWEDTTEKLLRAQEHIGKIENEDPDALSLGMLHLHYQTLLSYSTLLAFYFHLRASQKYAEKPTLLQTHPIVRRLLTLKQALITLEDLDFAASDGEESEDDDFSDDPYGVEMKWDNLLDGGMNSRTLWEEIRRHGLDDDELDELMADAKQDELDDLTLPKKQKTKAKEKKEKLPPKKKRKVDKEAAEPIFDLEEPEWVPSTKKSASRNKTSETEDAYGEATHLQDADAADKSARKKTLRFHTSKIESASARRNAARNQAAGGDDDIPYRERKKDKDLRLAQETKNRLAKQGGEDLDDVDPEMPSDKRKRADSDDDESGDDNPDEYYELIKKKSSDKKAKKKAEYEAARAAEKPDFTEEDSTGPRSLTRAILKNRGLTPHRSKSVRNPRVKKRQKFEKAKKKVSSQKAIFKGGLASTGGRYDGEASGISKVVKGVRLG